MDREDLIIHSNGTVKLVQVLLHPVIIIRAVLVLLQILLSFR